MSKNLEIELKLDIDPSSRDRLQASELLSEQAGHKDRLKTAYFDTPDFALRQAGYSLRVRKEGRQRIQAVKTEGGANAGLFVRSEWEQVVKHKAPNPDAIDAPLADAVGRQTLDLLEKIFVTDVRRTTRVIDHADMSAELVIDEGEIRAGSGRSPLIEVELELVSGSPRSMFDFARRLDVDVPVRLGVMSKAERGYRLLEGLDDKSFKAERILLDPESDVGESFVAIAQSCIRQFRRNEDLLLANGGPEALHQARVGIRRLRSAFSLFKPVIGSDERAELLRLELRELGVALGAVRNIDVLIPRVNDHQIDRLTEERAKAMTRLCGQLVSAPTRLLMIDLIEWLTLGEWRVDAADSGPLHENIVTFASGLLESRRNRLKRRGKGLASLDDEHRHQVRIEAKKLRYATEFFSSLYDNKQSKRRRKAFLGALEDMQDYLGELNDLATGPELLSDLGLKGGLPKAGRHERERLLDRSEDAFDKLIDAKRFWQ